MGTERLSYLANFTLSPELTQRLQQGPITLELVRAIEQQTNAYFNRGVATNVLVHPCHPQKGPEWAYFRPESEND